MQLVCLPGMHGTDELFEPLLGQLQRLGISTQTLSLPADLPQSLERLADYVVARLPDAPCVLLAESFSGCLLPTIAKKSIPNIAGYIFVASFIRCPLPLLVSIVAHLPSSLLHNNWLARRVLAALFLNGAGPSDLERCGAVIKQLAPTILQARLKLLMSLRPSPDLASAPSVYLRAANDRVVNPRHAREVGRLFAATQLTLPGPHFLLQTKPMEAADKIRAALKIIESKNASG